MMTVWDKRIVLPDETIILPEQVWNILYGGAIIEWRDAAGKERVTELKYGARFDRCTCLRDMYKTLIYERDKTYDALTESIGAVTMYYTGAWVIQHETYRSTLADFTHRIKLIDPIPYSEESGE